jgi:protein involved in polysaccharide export with SLBB domain
MKNTLRNKSVAVWGAGMLALLGSLGLTGCQTSDTAQVRFSSFAGQEELTGTPIAVEAAKLALGDPIRVVFSGITEPPPPHEEQIKEDGTIDLPNIGVIKAEGKTTVELQKEIYEKYVPNYFKRLTVTVSTENRVYYVQGQVRSSGRQAYLGPTSVLKAIATAGDFTDFANRKRVVLTRADGTRIIVDCVKAARDSTYDLPVFPGDKIEVLMRGF